MGRGAVSEREQVEGRLFARHPDLPAGVVVATVGLVHRRRRLSDRSVPPSWAEVEAAAEERLLLQAAMRGRSGRRRRPR